MKATNFNILNPRLQKTVKLFLIHRVDRNVLQVLSVTCGIPKDKESGKMKLLFP